MKLSKVQHFSDWLVLLGIQSKSRFTPKWGRGERGVSSAFIPAACYSCGWICPNWNTLRFGFQPTLYYILFEMITFCENGISCAHIFNNFSSRTFWDTFWTEGALGYFSLRRRRAPRPVFIFITRAYSFENTFSVWFVFVGRLLTKTSPFHLNFQIATAENPGNVKGFHYSLTPLYTWNTVHSCTSTADCQFHAPANPADLLLYIKVSPDRKLVFENKIFKTHFFFLYWYMRFGWLPKYFSQYAAVSVVRINLFFFLLHV